MIRIIRRNVRLILIFASTLSFYLLGWLPVWLFTGFSSWRARRWRVLLLRTWARWISTCIGLSIEVEGEPPEAPYILVSNHLSYLDILVYYACTPSTFVSKIEVKQWPILGWMAQTLEVLFLDRTRVRELPDMLQEIDRLWNHGEGILFFPEGTTSDGTGVLPFKSSLLAFASESGTPVHLSTLTYRTEAPDPPADSVIHWFGEAPLWGHAKRVFALRRIHCRVRFGPNIIQDHDRKSLARRLHAQAEKSYRAMKGL